MPQKIPTLRPPWLCQVEASQKRDETNRLTAAERGYCSKRHKAWRQAVLTASAWQCRECGKVCAGERDAHADHTSPVVVGTEYCENGLSRYDPAAGQCLCASCHGRKTAREQNGASDKGSWSPHPKWLPKSKIPLIVVCGPPASGKNAYVEAKMKPGDLVIDLDEIGSRMANTATHCWDRRLLPRAMRHRNKMLADLGTKAASHYKRAWLIVCEPLPEYRQYWVDKLGAKEVVVIETPERACESRILSAKDRRQQSGTARDWWREYVPRHGDKVVRPAKRRSGPVMGKIEQVDGGE